MAFSVSDAFMTKVGPLPAIAWAGMAGGAFVIYKYATQDKSEPVTAVVGDTVPDYATGGVGGADDFSDGYGNAVFNGNTPGTTQGTVPSQAIQNNSDWGKRAVDYLISIGTNPTDASFAISTYLYGTGATLNTVQSAALNTALRQFGNPPDGVIIPPPTTPPPASGSPNTPVPGSNEEREQTRQQLMMTGDLTSQGYVKRTYWSTITDAQKARLQSLGFLPVPSGYGDW